MVLSVVLFMVLSVVLSEILSLVLSDVLSVYLLLEEVERVIVDSVLSDNYGNQIIYKTI